MTKRKRETMPSLAKVQSSYQRQIDLLNGMRIELDQAMADFTLGHDAGLTAMRSGMGKFGRGSSSTDVSRTTESATYEFHRLQGACGYAAGLILGAETDLRKGTTRLERAGSAILNAWLDTDPEIGRERRAKRRAVLDGTTMPDIENAVAAQTMEDGGLLWADAPVIEVAVIDVE